jgi:hypothetical protein
MAKLTIDGRDYDIAPYKLNQMRKAAPFIDKINATAGAMNTMEGMYESAADLIEVLAIGVSKIDPAMTAEAIGDALSGSVEELKALQVTFKDLLLESGLTPGEAKAPLAPVAEGASNSLSDESSTN